MALATVVRSPVTRRMSPTSAASRARSLGSRRATHLPTSLPSASATRKDTAPAGASRLLGSVAMVLPLPESPPGVRPEREVVDQVANLELAVQELVDPVHEAEEEDARLPRLQRGIDPAGDEGVALAQDRLALARELQGPGVGRPLPCRPHQRLDPPVLPHQELRALGAHEGGPSVHELGEELVVAAAPGRELADDLLLLVTHGGTILVQPRAGPGDRQGAQLGAEARPHVLHRGEAPRPLVGAEGLLEAPAHLAGQGPQVHLRVDDGHVDQGAHALSLRPWCQGSRSPSRTTDFRNSRLKGLVM